MSLKNHPENKTSFVYSNVVDLISGETLQCACRSVSAVRKEEKTAMLSMMRTPKKQREAVLNLEGTGSGSCRCPKPQTGGRVKHLS